MIQKLLSLIPYFKRIQTLETENADLKDKLVKRQEDINKTNAYWKKRLSNLSKPNPRN